MLKVKRIPIAVVLCAFVAAFAVAGCASSSSASSTASVPAASASSTASSSENIDEDMTDELFNDQRTGETLYVFEKDGRIFSVENVYSLKAWPGPELEDGAFYRVVADVTYLNGGIAGYVNYPEIKRVTACEKVSPLSIGLPSIAEKRSGLTAIGDYADGDVFLRDSGMKAVWKDGAWIWAYDGEFEGDDGSLVCYRTSVPKDEIVSRISQGETACEDFFVMPPQQ